MRTWRWSARLRYGLRAAGGGCGWRDKSSPTRHAAIWSAPNASSSAPLGRLLRRLAQGVVVLFAGGVASDASGLSPLVLRWTRGEPLNEDTFVPFTIVAREQVSPTAFVLTVRPQRGGGAPSRLVRFFRDTHVGPLASLLLGPSGTTHAQAAPAAEEQQRAPRLRLFYWPSFLRETHPHAAVVALAWAHGLWSVEIRQPQLQVAREYTPLPPPPSPDDVAEDVDSGTLRFLVRRIDRGEVSTYLSSLRVGDTVDLRGPHCGYDVRARLGGGGAAAGHRVVFVAGGTGVAPALQTARVVLRAASSTDSMPSAAAAPAASAADDGREAATFSLLWANRQRADCVGCSAMTGNGIVSPTEAGRDSIVSLLGAMQRAYPGRFSVRCTVDEEGTFIGPTDLARTTGLDTGRRLYPFGGGDSRSSSSSSSGRGTTSMEDECRIHSQRWVSMRPATEIAGETCSCSAAAGGAGKNLLFVSGPEGFVEMFAGPKRWIGGQELQGPVGGVLGDLRRRYPDFWRDWLVFKL